MGDDTDDTDCAANYGLDLEAHSDIRVGRCYINTKTGGVYRLTAIAMETETLEPYACYTCVQTYTFEGRECPAGESFVRPFYMFAGKRADGRWYFVPAEEAPFVGHDPIDDQQKLYNFEDFISVAKAGLDQYYEVFALEEPSNDYYRGSRTYDEWYRTFHRWGSW